MLKEKLINVKNILRIIISCLIIIFMVKSCSMAVSYNLVNKETQVTNYETLINALNEQFNLRLNLNASGMNYSTYLSNWENGNIKFFRYGYENYGNRYTYAWQYGTNKAFSGNPTTQNLSVSPCYYYHVENWKTNPYQAYYESGSGSISLREPNTVYYCIYIDENNNIWEYSNSNFSVTDSLIPPFEFNPYKITTIDDYNIQKFSYISNIALGGLGNNTYYQLQVRLKDKNLTTLGTAYFNEQQECYYRDNALIVENNQRIIANSVYLYYYEPYYLEFTIYSDTINYEMQGYLYKFYPMNATISGDTITFSGDTTFNGQDQTIQNQTFLQNLYNKAFTVSGDYINAKIEELKNNNLFPSGDVELETKFLNLIENNNGDFKITWRSFTPHFSVAGTQIQNRQFIPSGEVNFSKLERENQEFQATMNWTRIILGFSLGALLLKNLWKTLMLMLGVGIQVYDTNEDEKEIAKKGDKK